MDKIINNPDLGPLKWEENQPIDTAVEKSGVLKPGFGSKRKRRNELVQRLKSTRRYAPPVKGGKKKGKKKRRKKLAQNLVRRRKGKGRF